MTFHSARRALLTLASVVALVALALPSMANAEPKPDINTQCSGPNIEGEGSTFAGPAEFALTGFNWETSKETGTGYNHATSLLACAGLEGQGTKETPTVRYNQTNPLERGSGSCLKGLGSGVKVFGEEAEKEGEKSKYPRVNRFPFCGTDEAPSTAAKAEMEAFATSASPIESIPFAQGAIAIVVHLPAGCTVTSEPVIKTVVNKLGRLALDQSTIEGIFRGTVTTWKQAAENNGHANNVLKCTGGVAEEESPIKVVVRQDKSGTTHVFKKFLEQVNNASFEAEEGTFACSAKKGTETKTWEEVSEGCENQRWPVAAKVIRPAASGNQGVAKEVDAQAGSISYADLAVAREYEGGFFSSKLKKRGENKKGEANHEFWAVVQQNPAAEKDEFADPASNKDVEKAAQSNCAKTVYIAKTGEKVPPPSTLSDWSKVKASDVSATYSICGLTYALAPQLLYPYLKAYGETEAESKAVATSVHDYLHWAVNVKLGGGGAVLKGHDYEKLGGTVQKEAELGAEEIGNTIP